MEKIIEKTNLLWASAVTLLTAVFGVHWWIFATFLFFNAVDYITGVIKAKYTCTESSNKGLKGIIKKVGYWVIVVIAFFVAYVFDDLGAIIGVDLGFTVLIGWFTLATFIINECRSILENLIEIGVPVPSFLSKGLEVASDKLEHLTDSSDDGKKEQANEK